MTTKTTTYYEVYSSAGFSLSEYTFDNQQAAIDKAINESACATNPDWAEYIVRQVVRTEIVIFNTRENTIVE
jgi:hypothetical protein